MLLARAGEAFGGDGEMMRIRRLGSAPGQALGDLSLDTATFIQGTASNGQILGSTPGSTISGSNLPPGFSINSAARTWAFNGTGSANTGTLLLIEDWQSQENQTPIDWVIASGVPVNTALPTIAGTPTEGHTLTATSGTYTNGPTSITGQWQKNGTNIAGATGATYTLPVGSAGGSITYAETASNGAGTDASAPEVSASVGPVVAATPPANTVAPTIAQASTYAVGQVLTFHPGTWVGDPSPTMTDQWNRGGVAITGATGPTYQLQAADNGATITLTRTATNVAAPGGVSVTTAGVGPITLSSPIIDTTVDAPTMAVTTANTVYPPAVKIGVTADAEVGVHSIQFQGSTSDAFGTTTFNDTLTPTDPQALAKLIHDSNLSSITSGSHCFRARLLWSVSGTAYATAWSNVAGHGDTTALTISTATTATVNEQTTMSLALTANKDVASWAVSGQDMAQVQVSGSLIAGWVLQWIGNGSQSYSSSNAADATENYQVKLVATDLFGNTASLSLTISVAKLDLTPDAFSFTSVSNATVSTDYTSNTITVAGIASGFSVPVSISGGTYSKNGGAFTAATGTALLGDTFAVKVHSASAGSTGTSAALSIGSGPATSGVYSVTTTGFTPNSLWLTTENGDWWDVNDLSLMFQDSAGTVPVTAAGQAIKRWIGKRGNIILSDANGLQLLNDGTSNYVYGAGTTGSHKLTSTGSVTCWDGSGQLTAFGSFMVSSIASVRELFNADDGTGSRVGNMLSVSSGPIRTSHYNTANTIQADNGNSATANTRFTARSKHTTAAVEAFINNTTDGSTAVSGTLRSGASTLLQVFTRNAVINEGKIYRGFGVIGRVITGTEETNLETWMAS